MKNQGSMKMSLRRMVALIALLGFGLSLIAHALTFVGINLANRLPLVWGLHIGIFPLFFLLMLSSGSWNRSRRITLKTFVAPLPRHTRIIVIGLFTYAIINFALFFFLSEGATPGIENGKYILHSHGDFIRELTESEYHWQQAYILRGFSGHWLVFYLIPMVYFWYPKHTLHHEDNGY